MAIPKPDSMTQASWDYLLRFTEAHEVSVLHMYNNRASAAAKQDVTCGIGFALDNRETALRPEYRSLFYDPATQGSPTDNQLRADWDAAAGLLRRGWPDSNLESTAASDGYADVCKLRMWPEKVNDLMASLLKQKLKVQLDHWLPAETFSALPAQAQVACASYFYGWSLEKAPNLRQALLDGDLTRAAKESKLNGASDDKNRNHARLFTNAASISGAVKAGWEKELLEKLPQNVKPPEVMIYSSETVNK